MSSRLSGVVDPLAADVNSFVCWDPVLSGIEPAVLDTLGFHRVLRDTRAHFLYLAEHDLASSVEKTGTALLLDEPFAIRGEARALSVQEAWR